MGTRPQPRPQVASLPLALPLVACCNVVAAFDDWKDVTKKRLPVFYYMYDTEEKNAMLIVMFKALTNVKERYKKQLNENEIMKEALLASPVNGLVGHILGYVNCIN